MQRATRFQTDRLLSLVGARVLQVIVTGPDTFGDEFFGLRFQTESGQVYDLTVLADDEGNGPGSFDLTPVGQATAQA